MILWVCSPPLPRFAHARYRQEMLDANGKNNEDRVMIVSTLCLDCKSIGDCHPFTQSSVAYLGFRVFMVITWMRGLTACRHWMRQRMDFPVFTVAAAWY